MVVRQDEALSEDGSLINMKNRNIYKDIVVCAVVCLCIALLVCGVDFWIRQQKSYELAVHSETDLTEEIVKEIGKIEGVYAFIPTSSCSVKLRLEEYTLEVELTGIDIDSYPVEWKQAREELVFGSSPVLFLGQEVFSSFIDDHGNAPGKSQIAEWTNKYQELQISVTNETERERSGKIGGILKTPGAGVFMERNQMQELYQISMRTTGGCAKIQGERNMENAKELLSAAGFLVE